MKIDWIEKCGQSHLTADPLHQERERERNRQFHQVFTVMIKVLKRQIHAQKVESQALSLKANKYISTVLIMNGKDLCTGKQVKIEI